MKIEKVIVSAYATNCYIVTIDDASIIIDPGDDAEEIIVAPDFFSCISRKSL